MSVAVPDIAGTPIRYIANLKHVKEVTLLGTADLGFWRDRLSEEGLAPIERGGKAQILIIAADMRFRGIRFRELSFSVLASRKDQGSKQDGAFLARAFNSCRWFAFCERWLFSTPYRHGEVQVSPSLPAFIQLARDGEALFRAEMDAETSAAGRRPSRSEEGGWEGPVFLPDRERGRAGRGRLFLARIAGPTLTYPFLPSRDMVTIRPSLGSEILQALADSGFAGKEWAIREDASHSRSKTFAWSCDPASPAGPGAGYKGSLTASICEHCFDLLENGSYTLYEMSPAFHAKYVDLLNKAPGANAR